MKVFLRVGFPDLVLCISRHKDPPQTPIKELTRLLPFEYLLKTIQSRNVRGTLQHKNSQEFQLLFNENRQKHVTADTHRNNSFLLHTSWRIMEVCKLYRHLEERNICQRLKFLQRKKRLPCTIRMQFFKSSGNRYLLTKRLRMSKYIQRSNIRLLLHQMEVEIVVKKHLQKKQKLAKRASKKRNFTHASNVIVN